MRIEQARFLFEVEGQSYRALKILNSLDSSQDKSVKTRSKTLITFIESKIKANKRGHGGLEPVKWSFDFSNPKKATNDSLFLKPGLFISKDIGGYFFIQNTERIDVNQDISPLCDLNTKSKRYTYFICPDSKIWQINLNDINQMQSRQFNDVKQFTPSLYGGYLVTSTGLHYYSLFTSNKEWSIQGKALTDLLITPNFLILRSNDKIEGYTKNKLSKSWEKNNVNGQLFSHSQYFGVINPNGYVQFFHENGSYQWKFHAGQLVESHEIQANGQLNLFLSNNKKVAIDLININGFKSWEKQTLAISSSNRPLIDSLLKIEPGNLSLWQLKVENLKQTNASEEALVRALDQTLQLSKEMNNPKSHLLENYNKTIGAYWVRDVESNSGFYPQLTPFKKGPVFIHANTGRIHLINKVNGRDLVKSQDSISVTSPLLEHEGTIYTVHKQKLQIRNDSLQVNKTVDLNFEVKSIHNAQQGLLIESWKGDLSYYNIALEKVLWNKRFNSEPVKHHFDLQNKSILSFLKNGTVTRTSLNGKKSMSIRRNQDVINMVLIQGQKAYLMTGQGRLKLVNLNNLNTIWSYPFKAQAFSMKKVSDHLIIGFSNQQIISLNAETGAFNWQWQGQNSLFVSPDVYKEKLYIDQGNILKVLNLKTGQEISKHFYSTEIGSPKIMNEKLYLSSRSGILHSFNLKD